MRLLVLRVYWHRGKDAKFKSIGLNCYVGIGCLWVQERGCGCRNDEDDRRKNKKGGRYGYYNTMAGACEF